MLFLEKKMAVELVTFKSANCHTCSLTSLLTQFVLESICQKSYADMAILS